MLQLGGNFNLPVAEKEKEKMTIELIKHVEYNTHKLPPQQALLTRNRSLKIIEDFTKEKLRKTNNGKFLEEAIKSTWRFTRDNPNIIFTKADKGNITVCLNKEDYIRKMLLMLNDTNTYIAINKDPSNKIIKSLHDLLMRWKKAEYISDSKYRQLNCTDGTLPRAYGLPKVHKEGCPLRIIVSSINTPLYSLAKFLQKLMYEAIPKAESYIENSFKLSKKLTGMFVEDGYSLIPLDVVSLFTNVPVGLAIDSIKKRWEHIKKKCIIPQDEFLRAVQLVLNSTYFTFGGQCYQQTFGTPMGSPLSPIIADLALQDLEMNAIGALRTDIPFYFRYVDDIVLAAPSSMLNTVLETFNSFHPRL